MAEGKKELAKVNPNSTARKVTLHDAEGKPFNVVRGQPVEVDPKQFDKKDPATGLQYVVKA